MIGVGAGELVLYGALVNVAAAAWVIICYRRRLRAYRPIFLGVIGGLLMLYGFNAQSGPKVIGGSEVFGILAFLVTIGLGGYTFTVSAQK